MWEREFASLRVVNFGISADRTENILYRLTHTELGKNPPRSFVLLAGTNNLSRDPPDSPQDTISGIRAIIEHILNHCPDSRLFILTLPPNGYELDSPLRRSILETNQLLKQLDLPARVTLIDIYPEFADSSHHWKKGLTIDGTHFSEAGYEALAKTLSPVTGSLNR